MRMLCLWLQLSSAGTFNENPFLEAARAVGRRGLAEGRAPDRSPTRFSPSGSRLFVDRFLSGYLDASPEREALKESLLRSLDDYEQAAGGTIAQFDASAALAYAVCVLTSTALGASLDEDAYRALIGRFQAAFDTPDLRAAGNLHKQELYERALCAAALVQTVARAVDSPAGRAGLRTLSRRQLRVLVGAEVDKIRLDGARAAILGTDPPKVVEVPAPAGSAFAYEPPPGWTLEEGWHVRRTETAVGVEAACLRFLPPLPAVANVGAGLRDLWKREVPKALADRYSTAVYRRRVGDGLLSYFLCGTGRQAGWKADTLFSLHVVVCGTQWQPVVVALTFVPSGDAPATYAAAGVAAEEFLAVLRCPPARNRPFVSREALAGIYGFGTRAALGGASSGAIDIPAAKLGGTLSLRLDGGYQYVFEGDADDAEELGVHDDDDEGRWSVEDDRLVLTPRSGVPRRYRIAGLTQFTGGPKVAVLLARPDSPLHPGTLGSRADWFSTGLK